MNYGLATDAVPTAQRRTSSGRLTHVADGATYDQADVFISMRYFDRRTFRDYGGLRPPRVAGCSPGRLPPAWTAPS
jgi:hypothetical protein